MSVTDLSKLSAVMLGQKCRFPDFQGQPFFSSAPYVFIYPFYMDSVNLKSYRYLWGFEGKEKDGHSEK